ncbi:hypothetical protein ACS0TY_010419 [Phlomoides rotata]
MVVDPLEDGLEEFLSGQPIEDQDEETDVIEALASTPAWSQWRDTIAQNMFNECMDPVVAHVGQDVDKGKASRRRRSCSRVEEDALIHCLTDIINDGWKAENGFKVGFQQELEKGMRRILPGTDIVANPHINSKIHVWKKEYSALSDLLSKSGIDWNSTTSMIEVEDEGVWEASKGADPQMKVICFKSWPYYSNWLDIFGKDRATGENAADPIDLVNDLLRNPQTEQEGETEGKTVPMGAFEMHSDENNSVSKPVAPGIKSGSKGTKRKNRDTEVNALVETLGEFMKQSNSTFGDIAKGIGPSTKLQIDNNKLNEIMNHIVGLKRADKLKVCDELVQNKSRLDFFMCLPTEDQEEYVWMLFDGRL